MNGKNIAIAVVISAIVTMILMNKKEKQKEEEQPIIIRSPFYNPYPYYGHPRYYSSGYYRGYGGRHHGRLY